MLLLSMKACYALGLGLTFATSSQALSAQHFDEKHFSPSNIIRKDVLVIGGGASGTYGAIKLLDSNKTVVVVEKEAVLGGHTNTYIDPSTNATIDYGVIIYHNNDFVRKFFARLNVPVEVSSVNSASVTRNVDFRTGKEVTNFVPQDPSAALGGYLQQLAKYSYVEKGKSSFLKQKSPFLPPFPSTILNPIFILDVRFHLESTFGD